MNVQSGRKISSPGKEVNKTQQDRNTFVLPEYTEMFTDGSGRPEASARSKLQGRKQYFWMMHQANRLKAGH